MDGLRLARTSKRDLGFGDGKAADASLRVVGEATGLGCKHEHEMNGQSITFGYVGLAVVRYIIEMI